LGNQTGMAKQLWYNGSEAAHENVPKTPTTFLSR
jgi:hypothetical protein